MVLSTVVDFICGKGCSCLSKAALIFLIISLPANLGLLEIIRYFGFFQDSLMAACQSIGITLNPITPELVLPVDISFDTFQPLSFSIDIYRRKTEPNDSLID